MNEQRSTGKKLTRRDFLKAGGFALAGTTALGIAGCGTGDEAASGPLSFFGWNVQPQFKVLGNLLDEYESSNSQVSVDLNAIPEQDFREWLSTRLAAGKAPDIQIMTWQDHGVYSTQGGLVDLSEYLNPDFGEQFSPTFWSGVVHDEKPYGLPFHTNGWGTFYNVDYFEELGVEVPENLDESWSWDEFIEIARRLKNETDAEYGFAMGWQGPGSGYRWLPFLYQHGGQLLNDDLSAPEINTDLGVEAIAWTQAWFEEGLVPRGETIKGTDTTSAANLFTNGTIGMLLMYDSMTPYISDQVGDKFAWSATFLPRDAAMACDLGGNVLTITKDCEAPEAAAEVIKFLVGEEILREYCVGSSLVPTRRDLAEQGLTYKFNRPELMSEVFVPQSTTIPEHMALVEILPNFEQINRALEDELDLAFTLQQDPETTAQNVSGGIEEVLAG